MSSPLHDVAGLVGRVIEASIGEPWDFTSDAGNGVLTGRIVSTSQPGEANEWIVCDVAPFRAGDRTITTVVATRRYRGEEPLQQLLLLGETHANLLYDPTGSPMTATRAREALRAASDGLAFLVGRLRLQSGTGASSEGAPRTR